MIYKVNGLYTITNGIKHSGLTGVIHKNIFSNPGIFILFSPRTIKLNSGGSCTMILKGQKGTQLIGLGVECSPMGWETRVQSQVESYQRLKKIMLDTSFLNTQHYKVRFKSKV